MESLKKLPPTTLPTEEQLGQIFSYNFRTLRLAANLTQKECTAIFGYSISTIRNYELGRWILPFSFLFAQSYVFHLPLASLLHIVPDTTLERLKHMTFSAHHSKEQWNTIYSVIKKNIFLQADTFPSIAAFARHCHITLDIIYRLHQDNPEISLHTVYSICTALSIPIEALLITTDS